jgi:pyrroline-5-carboxylate reductase
MSFCCGEFFFLSFFFFLLYRKLIFSIVVSCKPQIAHTILHEPGIKEALDGKLLISILAGLTMGQITQWVLPTTRVVRAMPNTPCKVCPPSIYLQNLG